MSEDHLPLNALGLPEGSLRSLLHTDTRNESFMPSTCQVDFHSPLSPRTYRSTGQAGFAFKVAAMFTCAGNPLTIHRRTPFEWPAGPAWMLVTCSEERNDPPGKPVAFW